MNKTRQWTLLTALGAVGILLVGWFVIVSPQHKHAASLRTQASGIEQSNQSLQAQVRQLQRQQAGVPAAQKQLAAIGTKIPDNPALPALIRQLSAAAKSSGVDLVSLAPGTPSAAGGPATSTAAAASSLLQIPVTISVTGSYFNAESFFNSIENLSRAMMVSSFTMAPGSGSSGGGTLAPGSITAQISAVMFEAPSLTPVAPAATTTAPAAAPSTAASAPASGSTSSTAPNASESTPK